MKSFETDCKKCVLIVEPDEKIRTQFGQALSSLEISVYLASNGSAAHKLLSEKQFDLAIADAELMDMSGVELLARIRALRIPTPFVLISATIEKGTMVHVLRLGISDLLEKPVQTKDLIESVQRVFAKEINQTRTLLEGLSLSQRHIVILEMVLKGMGNKEIATALKISEQGIKYHVGRLLKRFNARNRADLRLKINSLIRPAQQPEPS